MNERELDIVQVEVEAYLEKLLADYTRMWAGDRDGEKIYTEEGRQPIRNSESEQHQLRLASGG